MMMKIFKYIGYNEHFNIKYIRKGHFCNSKYQNHTLKYLGEVEGGKGEVEEPGGLELDEEGRGRERGRGRGREKESGTGNRGNFIIC